MWGLQHSCVLGCTAKAESWDHPASVQAEHVFGSTEGLCLIKALQQGLLLLH